MSTDFKKISNPLTIIAIFAGLAEINGTVVIGLVPEQLQGTFLWFIILFPTILVLIFFYILNYNPKVLYAPSDFSNEENFLKTIDSGLKKFEPIKMSVTAENYKNKENINDLIQKAENINFNRDIFLPETKKHLNLANSFWKEFLPLINNKFDDKLLEEMSYGIQAPEYFLVNYSVSKEKGKRKTHDLSDSIIIRVTEDENSELNLIAIGKNIIEKDPALFAKKVTEYVNDKVTKFIENE